MTRSVHATVPSYRALWLPDLLVLGVLAVVTTVLFWVTDLDLRVAGMFYSPDGAEGPWPQESSPVWGLFYDAAPFLTIALLGAGGWLLLRGVLNRRRRILGLYGVFIILVVLIGPGLVVNAIMKEYGGRPRPRQLEQFGGHLEHVPPLAIGEVGRGKSFPAGHASIGFSPCLFYFLLRRRRPWAARAALLGGVSLGLTMGYGRIVVGGHFVSDVLWSGFVVFGTGQALYYFLLRIPLHEDLPPPVARAAMRPRRPVLTGVVAGSVALALATGAMLATPANHEVNWRLDAEAAETMNGAEGREVSLSMANTNLTLVLTDTANPAPLLSLEGNVRGFGPPTSRLKELRAATDRDGKARLSYELHPRGWFTDVSGQVRAEVSTQGLSSLRVDLDGGDLRIIDQTRRTSDPPPRLELRDRHGRIEHHLAGAGHR